MYDKPPVIAENEAINKPKLIHGLWEAARNGVTFYAQMVAYELNPDQNVSLPIRQPNPELSEWVNRNKKT